MKNISKVFMAGIAMFGSIASVNAQFIDGNTAESDFSAAATINRPIRLDRMVNLSFGSIYVMNGAGSVTVMPGNQVITNGDVMLGGGFNPSAFTTPAGFTVQGEPNHLYTVQVPPSIMLYNQNVPGQMEVSNFMVGFKTYLSGQNSVGQLDEQGNDFFEIGGTLQVSPNQSAGNYISDPAKVTVFYN